MDNWTIAFSPGDFRCQAVWINAHDEPFTCSKDVPPGYIIARHPNWESWMCLSCMAAVARNHLREKQLNELGGV